MRILALDTSTLVSSTAILEDKKLLAELTLQTKLTHSETLLPHMKQLLAMAEVEKNSLEAIAVSIGPGSFTGLRIGLATAKSMAYALSVPVVGVPTLAALAYQHPVGGVYTIPVLDAQKGNVYQAVYTFANGALQEVEAPSVKSFSAVLEKAKQMDKAVVFVGEAAVKKHAEIEAAGDPVSLAMPHTIMPRAACVALLGQSMLKAGCRADAMTLEPFYIRRSEAEELWESKHGVRRG